MSPNKIVDELKAKENNFLEKNFLQKFAITKKSSKIQEKK